MGQSGERLYYYVLEIILSYVGRLHNTHHFYLEQIYLAANNKFTGIKLTLTEGISKSSVAEVIKKYGPYSAYFLT